MSMHNVMQGFTKGTTVEACDIETTVNEIVNWRLLEC